MNYLKLGKIVCQKINQNLPHISTTKMNRLVEDISLKNPNVLNNYYQLSSFNWFCSLRELQCKSSAKDSSILGILSWFNKKAIPNMNSAREYYNIPGLSNIEKLEFNLKQLLNRKMGNCQENAIAATTILTMNGVKNACVASLKHDNSYIDHVVSVFNKDGSLFTGEIVNNKTIIVDPWIGVTDYANNYFAKYRSLLSEFMYIPKEGKISLGQVNQLDINEKDLSLMTENFQYLLVR